jgi:hypothetical protein
LLQKLLVILQDFTEITPNQLTLLMVETISGVQMGPGATALTLMPLLTSWLDRERVKANCRSMGHTGCSVEHQPTM